MYNVLNDKFIYFNFIMLDIYISTQIIYDKFIYISTQIIYDKLIYIST
jgi:hypothetical protein